MGRVLQHPATTAGPGLVPAPAVGPVETFEAPEDLPADERAVWLIQAPYAFAQRTLTRASALAFARYCKVVVLERNEAKSSGVGGANHRGLLKQVNTCELQFLLTPSGRAMPATEAPAVVAGDQDEAFFGGAGAGPR